MIAAKEPKSVACNAEASLRKPMAVSSDQLPVTRKKKHKLDTGHCQLVTDWTPQRWKKEFLSAIPWNDQQLKVFEEVQDSDRNLMIEAVAGSGKSSVLKAIIGLLPTDTKINVLMYNISVKEAFEQDPRIPKRVKVSTAHGCCYGLLMSYFRGEAPKIEEDKALKLAEWGVRRLKDAIADYSYRLQRKQPTKNDYPVPPPIPPEEADKSEVFFERWRDELVKLLNFARLNLSEANVESLEFTCSYFAIRFPGGKKGLAWGIQSAIALLEDCYRQAVYDKVVDYADLVWLAHALKLYPRKPKAAKAVLLVDEAMDANKAFISLYKKFELAGYRCIFVGDEFQSICGYMASLPTAMSTIEKLFDAKSLPLAETQRCPKTHVALASLIVPSIKARIDAKLGHTQILHPNAVRSRAQAGDLILCRFVAPLVKLALETKFLENKEGVVRGRKIADEMIKFTKSIGRHCKWNNFYDKLLEQRDFLVQKHAEAEQLQLADAVADKYRCLEYCYEYLGQRAGSLSEFCDAITQAFPDEPEDRTKHIIYSSIHSAKGDEAENVFVIGSNILPYFRKDMLKWMFQQEINATYVAVTRSKANMFFVPLARSEKEIEEFMKMPLGGMKLEYFEGVEGDL